MFKGNRLHWEIINKRPNDFREIKRDKLILLLWEITSHAHPVYND